MTGAALPKRKATPSLPIFGDSYMADTRHLSLEEHGAYFQLLLIAWQTPGCRLPDDDVRLARMLSVTPGKWARLKGTVMAFWTLSNGWWSQKRLSHERAFVDAKRATNAASANERWDRQRLENQQGDGCERISERNAPPPPPRPLPPEEGSKHASRAEREQESQEAIRVWNDAARRCGWPLVQGTRQSTPDRIVLNADLQRKLNARLRENGLEGWREAVARAERSDFLTGADPPSWWTFAAIVSAEKFSKLQGGTYDRSFDTARPRQQSPWLNARAAVSRQVHGAGEH